MRGCICCRDAMFCVSGLQIIPTNAPIAGIAGDAKHCVSTFLLFHIFSRGQTPKNHQSPALKNQALTHNFLFIIHTSPLTFTTHLSLLTKLLPHLRPVRRRFIHFIAGFNIKRSVPGIDICNRRVGAVLFR